MLLRVAVALCAVICSASFRPEEAAPPSNEIAEFAGRYAQYAEANPGKSHADAVLEVNLGLDMPNYENALTAPDADGYTVFVSKHYKLPKNHKPDDLKKVYEFYAKPGVRLREECRGALYSMAAEMEGEGLSLYVKSGYRINRKRGGPDDLYHAWPGYSEHQTGLAVDFCKKGVSYKTLSEYRYQESAEYRWLCENAYRFGFILSYPEGQSSVTGFGFEPWHWRYIGPEAATDMRNKNISTFQRYWATCLIADCYSAIENAA